MFRSFLRLLGVELEQLPKVVDNLSPEEAKELERDMDETIRQIEELRGMLRARAQGEPWPRIASCQLDLTELAPTRQT